MSRCRCRRDCQIKLSEKIKRSKFTGSVNPNLWGEVQVAVDRLLTEGEALLLEQLVVSWAAFNGGNTALYGIHKLDIADKRVTLIPITMISGIPDHESWAGDKVLYRIRDFRFGPVVDGAVAIAFPAANNLEIGHEVTPAFDILFDRGPPFEREPIGPTLHQLPALVEGIIDMFLTCITTSS